MFSPVRFQGSNYLRKRHFNKIVKNGKKYSQYSERASVVVTETTPISFEYHLKQEKLTVLFYVQRYDENDFCLDATLQAVFNRNQVE